jgi:hypothetical protein
MVDADWLVLEGPIPHDTGFFCMDAFPAGLRKLEARWQP